MEYYENAVLIFGLNYRFPEEIAKLKILYYSYILNKVVFTSRRNEKVKNSWFLSSDKMAFEVLLDASIFN
jgi:hypothetical protein